MFEQITKFANEASTTVADNINDNHVSDRFVSTSDQVLDAVLDANRRIVDVAVTTADRLAEQINVELPFADRLPTPTVAGERYLEFVERTVSLNRDMNQRVAEMIRADTAKAASDKVVGTARNVADTATKTVGGATKNVSDTAKNVAERTVTEKASATKAPAERTAATKRPAEKRTAKTGTAKKRTATKRPAKKSTAKKSTAKKSTAKKSVATK